MEENSEQVVRRAYAGQVRRLLLGNQTADNQERIAKKLVEKLVTDSGFELEIHDQNIVPENLKKDELYSKLLVRGTNLPQLIVLMATVPSSYYGHPLFNLALNADFDNDLAFAGISFQKRLRELQNYVLIEAIENEFIRTIDEMSAMEHLYNLAEPGSSLEDNGLLKAFLEVANPIIPQTKDTPTVSIFKMILNRLRTFMEWRQATDIGNNRTATQEEGTKKPKRVDQLCYRILLKLWILRKIYSGYIIKKTKKQ